MTHSNLLEPILFTLFSSLELLALNFLPYALIKHRFVLLLNLLGIQKLLRWTEARSKVHTSTPQQMK